MDEILIGLIIFTVPVIIHYIYNRINDSIIIDSSNITLNNLSCELNDFTFTDFDKIYEAFCEYLNNKNK